MRAECECRLGRRRGWPGGRLILTEKLASLSRTAFVCAIAMPAPSPALRAPSPNGRGSADPRFETGTNA